MKRKSAVLALAVSFLTAASVQAVPLTYEYIGRSFSFAIPPYTPFDRVEASVTLDITANFGTFFTGNIIPIDYSFTDGVQTIQSDHPAVSFFIDAEKHVGDHFQGAFDIRSWNMTVSNGAAFIHTRGQFSDGARGDFVSNGAFSLAGNFQQGFWITPSVPDEGTTLTLMTLTLMALGLVARRFQRAAG